VDFNPITHVEHGLTHTTHVAVVELVFFVLVNIRAHVLSMVGVSPDISVSHSSTSVCTLASVRTASSSQCGFSEPGPANSRWLDPGRGAESLARARFGEERW